MLLESECIISKLTIPIYIATRCLFACLWLISSGTAEPIWLNFFCLLRLGHGVVLGKKKIPEPGSGFSGWIFFVLKPPRNQDGAHEKKFS